MIWNLFLISALAAKVKQELGDIYLYRNETFFAELHDYFEGQFLEFSLVNNEENESIIGNFNVLNELSHHWNSTSDSIKRISLFTEAGTSFIICTSGLETYLFEVDQISGKVEFILKKTVHTYLKDAEITLARIRLGGIFLIITGTEEIQGFNFTKNLLYHSLIGLDYRIVQAWDLAYVEDLSMNLQILPNMVFWGKFNRKSVVLLGLFKDNLLRIYQNIDHYYRYNSTQKFDLQLSDVLINMNNLMLLQKDLGVLIYTLKDFMFYEKNIILLNSYGNCYQFSKNNWQTASINKFCVVTDSGIVMIDFLRFNIVGFAEFNYTPDVDLIVLEPYFFLMSSSLSSLQIYKITDTQIFSLYDIPMNWTKGPATIIKFSIGYIILKETDPQIDFFNLIFLEKFLNVSSDRNSSVVIKASDSISSVSSVLNIFILELLNKPYLIFNYRKTNLESLNQNLYLDKTTQKTEVQISSTITGWYIDFNITTYKIEGFNTYLTINSAVNFQKITDLYKIYKGIIYFGYFFSIDEDGFYINENLTITDKYPKNITYGLGSVQILYSNYIIFYFPETNTIVNRSISINCDLVFKFILRYTFCADLKNLLIISDTVVIKNYDLKKILDNENLIDVGYSYNFEIMSDHLFLLSDSSISFILHSEIKHIVIRKITVEVSFIITTDFNVYAIGNAIYVYDLYLLGLFRIIPLPDPAISVWNSLDTLYIKTLKDFLVINGAVPVIQSLVFMIDNYYCDLHPSLIGTIFTICNNSAIFFSDSCQEFCYPKLNIFYSVANSSSIKIGLAESLIETAVISPTISFQFNITLSISTYSIFLYFNESIFTKNIFMIDYDKSLTIPLSMNFLGFNLDFSLYINDKIVDQKFDWVSLNPRVIQNGHLPQSHFNFIDHDVIRGTEYVLFLTESSIEIYKISFNYQLNKTLIPVFLKRINFTDFLVPITVCSSLDYISTINRLSLFVLVCSRKFNVSDYYDGSLKNYTLAKDFLTFIEIDSLNLSLVNSTRFGIDHTIVWIHVITASPSCFVIICLDDLQLDANIEGVNNNAYIYRASWKEKLIINRINVINFSFLNLSSLQVTCADGIYFCSSDCESSMSLYIYLADKQFGLRMVKINEDSLELVNSVEYSGEYLTSIGICGNSLFGLSNITDIDEFFFDKDFVPRFYITFQPSYAGGFVGVNSVISCSTYYRPRYIGIYLFSTNENFYQLRLVDLKMNLYSSYVKFINIPGELNLNYKGKSVFINENLVTVLSTSYGEFFTYLISDLEMTFPEMSLEQYQNMKSQLKSDSFTMKIVYSNDIYTKSSACYSVSRIGPDDDDDSDENGKGQLWWLWVIFSIIALIISVVTLILYKRYFGRRREAKEQIKPKNLISMVRMNPNMRLSMVITESIN